MSSFKSDCYPGYFKINFFPEEEYWAEYDIMLAEIKKSFGIQFTQVMKEIQMELKKLDADSKSQISVLGNTTARRLTSTIRSS